MKQNLTLILLHALTKLINSFIWFKIYQKPSLLYYMAIQSCITCQGWATLHWSIQNFYSLSSGEMSLCVYLLHKLHRLFAFNLGSFYLIVGEVMSRVFSFPSKPSPLPFSILGHWPAHFALGAILPSSLQWGSHWHTEEATADAKEGTIGRSGVYVSGWLHLSPRGHLLLYSCLSLQFQHPGNSNGSLLSLPRFLTLLCSFT